MKSSLISKCVEVIQGTKAPRMLFAYVLATHTLPETLFSPPEKRTIPS